MRLHRLEMTAFGPFAQTAVVDFDKLGSDGLFLLHGHTGAGKTTVLDAVAFALYGRVPGARNESKRLHSDHADPQTAPRVSLEATLGGRRLRLIRTPEFERPKKRGVGFRTENASATLEWLDGKGRHLSRIPDIGDEVVRLLGMSAEQFFQVVLLPQGDFARFLRAENEGREALLEKLFDTERFGTAERWLDDRRKVSEAELNAAESRIGSLVATAGMAAGLSAVESIEPDDVVAWSEQLLDTMRTTAATTLADLHRCRAEADQARAAADTERRRHDLRRRATAARNTLTDLAATAAHRHTLQADLDRARRAEPVATALAEARSAAVAWRNRRTAAHTDAERLAARLLQQESADLPGTYWAAADLAAAELAGTTQGQSLSRVPLIGPDDAGESSGIPGTQESVEPAAKDTPAQTDSRATRKRARAAASPADVFAAQGLWGADEPKSPGGAVGTGARAERIPSAEARLWHLDEVTVEDPAAVDMSVASAESAPRGSTGSKKPVRGWSTVNSVVAPDDSADGGLWAADELWAAQDSETAGGERSEWVAGVELDPGTGEFVSAETPEVDECSAGERSAPGAESGRSADESTSVETPCGSGVDSRSVSGERSGSRAEPSSDADEPVSAEMPAAVEAEGRSAAGGARPGSALAPEPGLDRAIRLWTAQIGLLDGMRSAAGDAERLGREAARLQRESVGLTTQMRAATARRMELPEALRIAEIEHRAATESAAALPGLQAEWERLTTAAAAAAQLVGCRVESDRATAEFEAARVAHVDARERTLDVRERRLAGMAAELAGGLADGAPCLVCGSAEHPAPARPASEAVSRADEDRAVAAERSAENRRDLALKRCTELQRKIEILVERGGDADPAELAAALRAATTRRDDAGQAAAREADLTVRLTRLRSDETRVQEELQELEGRIAATRQGIADTDARLAELTARLREAAGADGTVDKRRDRLTTLIADATALRTARTDKAAALEQVLTLAAAVEQHAAAAGLESGVDSIGSDDPESAARTAGSAQSASPVAPHGSSGRAGVPAAAGAGSVVAVTAPHGEPDFARLAVLAKVVDAATRTAAEQNAIEAQLVAADRARAHAETVLADPDIQGLADIEPGDPDAADAAAAAARTRQDAAVAANAEAERRVRDLADVSSQLWAAVDRVAPVRAAHAELAGLAKVVSGRDGNNRKMSLRSYVLAARLEEVAVAGSARLRRMSGGRYEFVHTDAAGPRGRRGGLGLDVRDDYTGAVRPAKTLSGGETFMASLALALGLADVVAAESGGMVLDTLFIDEGFGSLDSDTLDAVMGVLDDLRSNGRVVGVVSHVDEMRQRIPSRLHVIRGADGSRLHATTA